MKKNNFDKIPKDWEVKSLADVTDIKVGKDLMQDSFSEIKTNEHKYPVYSNSHVNYGLYGYYNFKEYTGNSVTVVGRGDVGKAFKRSGSFGAIGRLIVLFPNEILDNTYLSECINFHVSFHQESSAVPQLTGKQIGTYSIPLPPLPEQQKIAEILSTVDDKIEVIDQQITETQALKNGLMQRLLTKGIGHTEFKDSPLGEIPKSWEVVKLDDVAIRGSGHTPNKQIAEYYNGGIKWVSLGDSKRLDNRWIENTKIEISKEGIKNSSAVLHPKETVLLSRDAGVGKSAVMKTEMGVSQHFITWNCKEFLNNWFLYYTLQNMKPTFERVAIGSTIKTIGLGFFKKLTLALPSKEEQDKIADILYTVDDKLEVLSEKKTYYQELKQGLMQQLLTGKIRVKI
jgi:type I restriction enzyme S subunit